MIETAKKAKEAAAKLAVASTKVKNKALNKIGEALINHQDEILNANALDLKNAQEKGVSESLQDRLKLNEARIKEMAVALEEIVALKDPVGEIVSGWLLPNGLKVSQVRVPLGVVGVIYEARPNVTVDASALALKAGNAVILRGGSLAEHSNRVLVKIIAEACQQAGLPLTAVQAISSTERSSVLELIKLDRFVDLVVPRGGAELIKTVTENATVPVLFAGAGNCHIYIHLDADFDMAENIVINAKVQRPSVCNAVETVLVHSNLVDSFLPRLLESLEAQNVTVFGCPRTQEVSPNVKPATEADWFTEYLDLKLAVKVVDSLEEAINHINFYGTKHSEAIITKSYQAAKKFTQEVDAAAVYVNASTRFTDGGQFGLGAEIGISTQKLHARGPMGLKALTSVKYVIDGDGQIRS